MGETENQGEVMEAAVEAAAAQLKSSASAQMPAAGSSRGGGGRLARAMSDKPPAQISDNSVLELPPQLMSRMFPRTLQAQLEVFDRLMAQEATAGEHQRMAQQVLADTFTTLPHYGASPHAQGSPMR